MLKHISPLFLLLLLYGTVGSLCLQMFDTNFPVIKLAPANSGSTSGGLFGYSLAIFSTRNSSGSCSVTTPSGRQSGSANTVAERCHQLLIGAPLGDQFDSQSGALYSCQVNSRSDDCKLVETAAIKEDLSRPAFVPQHGGKAVINPSYQWSLQNSWFGVSVSTPHEFSRHVGDKSEESTQDMQGILDDFAVVCANQFAFLANERYISEINTPTGNTSFYTGLCLQLDKDLKLVAPESKPDDFDLRFPCPLISSENSNNVGCQTGFDSDVTQLYSKDSESITKQFIYGAPITGQSYHGMPVVQELVTYPPDQYPDFNSRPTVAFNRFEDTDFGTSNYKVSTSVSLASKSRPLLPSNIDLEAFSNADDTQMQYLAGAPMFGRGAVFLETDQSPDESNSPELRRILKSEIMAQGFARSVVAVDIDGDLLSEVLIGAPDYFEHLSHSGAVYIFTHTPDGTDFNDEAVVSIKGSLGSQFGHALANLGDVNFDGCQDFAIGAPFEPSEDDSNNSGAVYIYFGMKTISVNSFKIPDQVLRAMQFSRHSPSGTIHAFGYAFASARDVDNNNYLDLAIGAPGFTTSKTSQKPSPGMVILVRSRPLIHVTVDLQAFSREDTKTPLQFLDISSSESRQQCAGTYPGGLRGDVAACFFLQICLTLHNSEEHASTAARLSSAYVDLNIQLDSDFLGQPRAVFANSQTNSKPSHFLELKRVELRYPETKTDGAGCQKKTCEPLKEVLVFGRDSQRLRRAAQDGYGGSTSSSSFSGSSTLGGRFQPLLISLNYSLSESQSGSGSDSSGANEATGNGAFEVPLEGQLIDLHAYPVLNVSGDSSHLIDSDDMGQEGHMGQSELVVQFAKDCGKDQICYTDAQLQVYFQEGVFHSPSQDGLSYGYTGQELVITMHVSIDEEPAYEPGIFIAFPEFLWFDSVYPECQYSQAEGQIKCTFANKVESGEFLVKNFTFIYKDESAKFPDNKPADVEFNFNFLTISNFTENSVVNQNLSLRLYREADIRLNGAGSPETIIYGGKVRGAYSIQKEGNLKAIGQQVVHSYEVFNYGFSEVPKLAITVSWPQEAKNGKYLLYVIEFPTLTDAQGNAYDSSKFSCTMEDNFVDPLEISSSGFDTESSGNQQRARRNVADEPSPSETLLSELTKESSKLRIDCFNGRAKCSTFSCVVLNVKSKTGVKLSVKSRLWNSTFIEDMPKSVDIASFAIANIIDTEYLHQEQLNNDESSVITRAIRDPQLSKKKSVPIWVIVLAVIGGILLLLLIIIICAKLGFFRRRQVNRANDYRPAPLQTFQLGEMEVDYRNNLDDEPIPSNVATGSSSRYPTGSTRKFSGKMSLGKQKSSSNKFPTTQQRQDPFAGYWGDVSNI